MYNPQAWDRYAYGSNNPLNYIDPTGHDDTPWYMKLAAVLFVVNQAVSVAQGQGIDNAQWEAAANVFLPPQAPGTQVTAQATAIGPGVGAFSEMNLVSHYQGEIELYVSNSTVPAVGSPQAGVSLSGGPIFGDKFAVDGTEAFGGNSEQVFGGGSLGPVGIGGDAWGGFDDSGNPLTWDGSGQPSGVWGLDTGITVGLSSPLSVGGGMLNSMPFSQKVGNIVRPWSSTLADNVTKTVDRYTHFQLQGPWLFGCRALGMCGRNLLDD